ncbi:DUF4389 domain-containing protein [Gaiella sp.]|uniref:DUF4389 domain-containing protein n=1 Tax=Gaiella sp. TaxID=2663207 RepID=UPI003982D988
MEDDQPLPIRIVVTDDLARSRVTVFFRLFLAIPHLLVLALWGIAALAVTLIVWIALIFRGKAPRTLQEFVAAYVRYATQVSAYLYLAAAPYPSFGGAPGYPIDLEIELASRQSRGSVAARLVLALPALLLITILGSGMSGGSSANITSTTSGGDWWLNAWTVGGVSTTAAVLAWFAILARGRMPIGLRDLLSYCIGYTAHATGYVLLLTDRYPTTDPTRVVPLIELPTHPVRLELTDEIRRSRLTVFFRFPLAVPHLIWLLLWTTVVIAVMPFVWLIVVVIARLPVPLHRFFTAWIRYSTHVIAFLYVIGGPFPGFTGRAGSYPVDIAFDPPRSQRRVVTAFRAILGIPAFLLAGAFGSVALLVGFLGWWAALVTASMPEGLRNLGAVSLRYSAQVSAYVFLVTESYPYAAPAVRDRPRDVQLGLPLEAPGPDLTAMEAL